MIVSRKQSAAADLIVKIFDDGPRQRNAVIGAGATSNFIQDDQRLRGVAVLRIRAVSVISTMNVLCPRDSSSLAPTLAKILSTIADGRADLAGTKLPIWASKRDQGDLANVSTFARHVGPGNQMQDARIVIERSYR